MDGWVITERLLADLAPLDDRLLLVVDDVHEFGPDALAQLGLPIMRALQGCGLCWPPGMTCGRGSVAVSVSPGVHPVGAMLARQP
jgi:hypothetical protein